MTSGPVMLTCDRCGQSFSSQYMHRCAVRTSEPMYSPREAIIEAMKMRDDAPAVACVNCVFYRPIDAEVRQEGQCYLMPPVLSPQTENPWVRPNVRWSDMCSQFEHNRELEVGNA